MPQELCEDSWALAGCADTNLTGPHPGCGPTIAIVLAHSRQRRGPSVCLEDLNHQLEWQARHRHSTRSGHRIGGAQGIQNRLLGRVDGGREEAVQMLFCHTGCLDDGPPRLA
jgi:hypothetical protein